MLRLPSATPNLRIWRHASAGALVPSPEHADRSPWDYMRRHDARRADVHTTELCGPHDHDAEAAQALCLKLEWCSEIEARADPPQQIILNRRFATLGRSPQHHNTITILSRVLSRTHSAIYQLGGSWYVRDMNTTNGTYLNKNPMRDAFRLRVGVEVAFSGFFYKVISC